MPIVLLALAGAILALAIWAGIRLARAQPVILRQLIVAGVIEVAIVLGMIVAGVQIAGGHVVDPVLFWGYEVTALLILPAAAVVAVIERTRWSSVALIAACVTLLALLARVYQLWTVGP